MMKLTTEQCLEGAKKHGEEIMVCDGDWETGKFEYPVYSFNQDELTAYTNDRVEQALANTNPNSAEIQRLKVEIEVLDSLSAEFFQSQDSKYDIQRKAHQRRARLAELTKGE